MKKPSSPEEPNLAGSEPNPGVTADPSLLGKGEDKAWLSSPPPPSLTGKGAGGLGSAGGASAPAIEVTNLVKEFRVYHRTFASLKSHAGALAKALVQRESRRGFETRRILDGVTFTVSRGESVALVGRNGSGKSTLLSILSRIYLPTAGTARLRGRMMSLLELGAGFDMELTGAQNIFFNGVILGLTESEVAARYDAIIDFAELDRQTMDLPVRMYSSGMQLRLGFAIAVSLDADLLLVDEGLAVGDEGFQEKCFRKMEEFKTQGRTILMVTHELDHIERLADRVLWLDQGRIARDGDVPSVLAEYRKRYSSDAPS